MGLFLALNGEGPVPTEWWISRLCEEFHCLPSEALREWRTAPAELLETIVEFRAFAQAKAVVERAKKKSDIPDTAMCHLVQEIEFDLVERERAEHG